MLTFLSRLSESFWKTFWFRCPVCWSMQIIWHLWQGPETWEVRREKTALPWKWPGRKLGPGGLVVRGGLRPQSCGVLSTLAARSQKEAPPHVVLGNHPYLLISWKTAASGLHREREEWLLSQVSSWILPGRKELTDWRVNWETINTHGPSTESSVEPYCVHVLWPRNFPTRNFT